MAALRLTISTQEQHPPKKTQPPQKKTHYLSRCFFGPGLNKEKKRIKEAQIPKVQQGQVTELHALLQPGSKSTVHVRKTAAKPREARCNLCDRSAAEQARFPFV